MSYLLRVVLPDRPGMLGAVATAIGHVGGDIVSLDVVERGPEGAVDDLLVVVPPGGLADTLITAAQSVPGVIVESLRPYLWAEDLHRDLELVDELAASPRDGLFLLAERAPGVFRAGWALLLDSAGGTPKVIASSAGAPDLDGVELPWMPLAAARRMGSAEEWVPERWNVLGTELATAPVGRPDRAVLVGRPGGPRFRASEVLRLAHLAGIASTVTS
ncbi:MAG: amino acid-binding protein [Frankiales bacterium]|nr:amino acid-binding protein [Frankiales bacterium]